jgi:hypothetical protein
VVALAFLHSILHRESNALPVPVRGWHGAVRHGAVRWLAG